MCVPMLNAYIRGTCESHTRRERAAIIRVGLADRLKRTGSRSIDRLWPRGDSTRATVLNPDFAIAGNRKIAIRYSSTRRNSRRRDYSVPHAENNVIVVIDRSRICPLDADERDKRRKNYSASPAYHNYITLRSKGDKIRTRPPPILDIDRTRGGTL